MASMRALVAGRQVVAGVGAAVRGRGVRCAPRQCMRAPLGGVNGIHSARGADARLRGAASLCAARRSAGAWRSVHALSGAAQQDDGGEGTIKVTGSNDGEVYPPSPDTVALANIASDAEYRAMWQRSVGTPAHACSCLHRPAC